MASKGNSTSVSRKMTTQTVNGKTVTKTVITERTVGLDGKKTVNTREEVTEGGSNTVPMSAHVAGTASEAKPKDTDKKPQKMKDFVKDVIKAHNVYREKHGQVGDLKSNSRLDDIAQAWAERIAAKDELSHSGDKYNGDKLGENVAFKWGSGGADYTGQEVTECWYSEIEKFNFNRNEFKSGTGHFTQVIWKGSKEIGVGKAHSKKGAVYVVCNYFPAGNMMGDFSDNVFPVKHK